MGRKCIIKDCRTNYRVTNKEKKNEIIRETLKTFSFPNKTKHAKERERWIKSIPFWKEEEIEEMKTPVICEKHWPAGFAEIKGDRGRLRPAEPPSIFEGVEKSAIPTLPPKERPTTKSSYEARTRTKDELNQFKLFDKVDYNLLVEASNSNSKNNKNFPSCVISYQCENALWIQSKTFISGIPAYAIRVFENLTFIAYQLGIECTVQTLSKNRMTTMNSWSRITEAIRYLSTKELNRQENVLRCHIEEMRPRTVGKKTYSLDTLIRAYSYFSTSRSLYKKLRRDYKLPSVKTLTNLTSKVNNTSDRTFLSETFKSLKENQRQCVVMVDEVYIKKALLYHGGTVFGNAKNDPSKLATTMLGIMIKCLMGGPTFLLKMIPINGLDANFLFEQVNHVVDLIKDTSGEVASIVCDGNRTNQRYSNFQYYCYILYYSYKRSKVKITVSLLSPGLKRLSVFFKSWKVQVWYFLRLLNSVLRFLDLKHR